jgi:hypothetical protein
MPPADEGKGGEDATWEAGAPDAARLTGARTQVRYRTAEAMTPSPDLAKGFLHLLSR